MKVYASCSSYVLGSLFGPPKACELINAAVQNPRLRPPCFAVQALRELATLADVELRVEGGASHIGKSRSRHLHAALESDAAAWVTIDDDVNASAQTLAWLLEAIDSNEPRVCIAPCLMRTTGDVVNVEWSPIYRVRELSNGGSVRSASAGGFGLVAMNRSALVIASSGPPWRDPSDGRIKAAAFAETFTGSDWHGEDISFFKRLAAQAPGRVAIEALTSGKTIHAGHELALEALA